MTVTFYYFLNNWYSSTHSFLGEMLVLTNRKEIKVHQVVKTTAAL